MKTKNVNIELIRIVAIVFVVVLHYFRYGGGTVWPDFASKEYVVYWYIDAFVFVCVDLFVLISGYCLINTKFKLSRLVRLWLEVEFYSVSSTLICKLLGCKINLIQLLKAAMPFTTEAYWYVTAYAIMLCFYPFLNLLLNCMDAKQYKALIFITSLIFAVLPTIFVWERDLLTTGMDYEWFIALYIIGAYIRKYGINCSGKDALIGYIICSSITGLARVPLGMLSKQIIGSPVLSGLFFRYNSITVVMASVFLFCFLLNIELKNGRIENLIIKIAPLTFAVYLIHDNSYVREILWSTLPMKSLYNGGILMYLGGLVVIVPSIFVLCCLIEKIRIWIFELARYKEVLHKIDLLIEKRNVSF